MTIPTATILSFGNQLDSINTSLQGKREALSNQSFLNTQLFGIIIGATLGLVPFFYLLYKDRPKIKVKVNHVWVPSYLGNLIQNGFSITISNFGRRSVNLENVFLKFKSGESLVFMSNSNFVGGSSGLPKNLSEGNSHTVAILAGEIARPLLEKKAYPTHACYGDALGRVYKCKTPQKFWDTMFKVASSNDEKED